MKKIYLISISILILKISFDFFMIPEEKTVHSVIFIYFEILFLMFLLSPLSIPFYIISLIILGHYMDLHVNIIIIVNILFLIFSIYYQWFVFRPKYLDKKRIKNNDFEEFKGLDQFKGEISYGKVVSFNIKTEKQLEDELLKKVKSLITLGYSNKKILNIIKNIDDLQIENIRTNLFK